MKYLFAVVFLNIVYPVMSQVIPPVSIGQEMPDILIEIENRKISMNALKGKAVILDFWNIWCTSCLKGFSQLELLQQEFNQDLQIIKITRNSKEEAAKIMKRYGGEHSTVVSVTGDTVFNRLFPHLGDPLHVWIDKNGIIQYITNGYNASSNNIKSFLRGEQLPFGRRSDLGDRYPQKNMIEHAGTVLAPAVLSYSILLRGYHEYSSESGEMEGKKKEWPTLQIWNATLLDLYRTAYFQKIYNWKQPPFFEGNNRIQLEVASRQDFFRPSDSATIDLWQERNIYSYELWAPHGKEQKQFDIMQQDLNRNLDYDAVIERRNTKCLQLVRINPELSKGVTKRKNEKPDLPHENISFSIKNGYIDSLVQQLAYLNQHLSIPLINATGIENPISITLYSPLDDLLSLRRELRHHGLDLVDGEREINMLIIRDKRLLE